MAPSQRRSPKPGGPQIRGPGLELHRASEGPIAVPDYAPKRSRTMLLGTWYRTSIAVPDYPIAVPDYGSTRKNTRNL